MKAGEGGEEEEEDEEEEAGDGVGAEVDSVSIPFVPLKLDLKFLFCSLSCVICCTNC